MDFFFFFFLFPFFLFPSLIPFFSMQFITNPTYNVVLPLSRVSGYVRNDSRFELAPFNLHYETAMGGRKEPQHVMQAHGNTDASHNSCDLMLLETFICISHAAGEYVLHAT